MIRTIDRTIHPPGLKVTGRSFDNIADRFDDTRAYPTEVMDLIIRNLSERLTKGGRYLDAGIGTGRFAEPLQRRGFDITGVDISRRMLAKARAKGTENVILGDICALPFRDKAFEHTMSVHVMHLISDWRCAISEIARVTRGELLSVGFYKEDSEVEEFRKFYLDVCRDLGHEIHHAGVMERDLPEIIKPDRDETLTRHIHPVDVQTMINNYETRTFSDQWDVPDDVHEGAMDALMERYGGLNQLIGRERIALIAWRAERLGALSPDQTKTLV
ncbi:MAG: methyltransferase domain-containing protein [Thermoplasmata archaeon]|nr:methyltransferase domain-containing protein [Thermoplasmata archaeon]